MEISEENNEDNDNREFINEENDSDDNIDNW